MANRFCLRVDSATSHFNHNPEFILSVAKAKGIVDYALPRRPVKELIHWFTIYKDWSSIVQVQANPCDRRFTLTRSVIVNLVCLRLYQGKLSSVFCSLWRPVTGHLSLVGVVWAPVNFKSAQHPTTLVVFGQHPLNC